MNRANVQGQLWNCVLNMRNGTLFNETFSDFITSIDMCKINKYDNPELVYGRNDAVILKRLFAVFSFRPIILATMSGAPINDNNTFVQSNRPSVTTLPMINLRLPPSLSNIEELTLEKSLNKNQSFVENGVVVVKSTNTIYSRGIITFFVDRRSNYIKLPGHQSFNLGKLPKTISGSYDRVNLYNLSYNLEMTVGDERFQISSIIAHEVMVHPDYKSEGQERFISIGSSCYVFDDNNVIQYNPLQMNNTDRVDVGNVDFADEKGHQNYMAAQWRLNQPFRKFQRDADYAMSEEINKTGCIFIYRASDETANKNFVNNEATY
jgi:hypothetical protein